MAVERRIRIRSMLSGLFFLKPFQGAQEEERQQKGFQILSWLGPSHS